MARLKKTQVFPVVADNFSGNGGVKKGGTYGDSGFSAGH
jgi:hypothetical protein